MLQSTRWLVLGCLLASAGCAPALPNSAAPFTAHVVPAGTEVARVSLYPKSWAGEKVTWVDVVVRNTSTAPRRYRALVLVDDEPPFAVSSDKPLAPRAETTLTVSTSARNLPSRLQIQIEVID